MQNSQLPEQHSLLRLLWNAAGTGGLRWHAHAMLQRANWKNCCVQIERYLLSIEPKNEHLLLIGPSAGWMLPQTWLEKYKFIEVFDIDPLASFLFDWRHGRHLKAKKTNVSYHRLDAIAHLEKLLTDYPNASIWFDNVLGQHRYRVRDMHQTESELKNIKNSLAQREWGSLHDWLSGPINTVVNLEPIHAKASQTKDQSWTQQLLGQIHAQGTWSDHLTSDVFPADTNCQYLSWPYSADYGHWLQIGWVST
jgi:hypothetical protein